MITHGTPDSPYSMTACVRSSMGVMNGISGAAQKVLLVDTMDSMSWSVAMVVEDCSIILQISRASRQPQTFFSE